MNSAPLPVCALGTPAPTGPYVALVPGSATPILTLDLPDGLKGLAREDVARRQLSDRLGADAKDVQLRPFFPPDRRETWSSVLVADARDLELWRESVTRNCKAVIPDYLALPASPEVWVLHKENEIVQARLGVDDGFSADVALASLMLDRAMANLPAPTAVLALGDQAWGRAFAKDNSLSTLLSAQEAAEHDLEVPSVFGHGELGFDLRADPRAARDRLARQILPWRWPALAALVAVSLWGASQFTIIQRLEQADSSLRSEILSEVRATFVPVGPILDIRTQVSRALTERSSAAAQRKARVSPLTLFAQAAQVIAEEQAASEAYVYQNEELRVVLRMADFAGAEALVASLREAGLNVEVDGFRVSDGEAGVRTELRIGVGT